MIEPPVSFFVALEVEVWEALRCGDAAADERLLAQDFLGVYPTGFADRADHVDQLEAGATVADYEIGSPQLIPLGPSGALLVYEARYRRPDSAEGETMFVSSLWVERAGAWVNIFSQDTPASDIRPV